jgi:hypothetical protein
MEIFRRARARGRGLAAFTAAAGLLASGLVAVGIAAPAHASAPLIACSWIEGGRLDTRENTMVCRGPGKPATLIVQRDCWKYQPPRNSFVRVRSGSKWIPTRAQVAVRKVDSCPDSHPWLTRVRIPTAGIAAYDVQRYRLVMPAHEVVVDDSIVQVRQTRLNFFVCMMRQGSSRTC